MSKVICDICGTSYPDTAQQCPICGYSRDLGPLLGEEDLAPAEPAPAPAAPAAKGGRFSAANVKKRNQAEAAYEVQPAQEPEAEDEDDEAYSFEYDDEPQQSNAVLVALLVVVIVALLAVTGYIALRYYLPNVLPEETITPTSTQEPTLPEETDPPHVACTSLAMLSSSRVELTQEGQYWLIHVVTLPADCTDELTYASSDETVATVSSDGRVTAVAAGEAVITITCGDQQLTCTIVCNIVPETTEVQEPTE